MRKRIIYIILGSLLLLALTLGLWFWFFGKSSNTNQPSNLFGTGGTKTATSTGSSTGGSGQAPYGSTAGTGVSGDTGGDNTQTPIFIDPNTQTSNSDVSFTDILDNDANLTPDIVWNNSFSGSSESVFFDPTLINIVENGNVSGTPSITKVPGADGQDISLLSSLGVVIGGCILNYGVNWVASYPTSVARALVGGSIAKVQVSDSTVNNSQDTQTISQCLVRTLGRLAVQAITDSIVNWINSGFQGKPAFVQDFKAFFANVADQAAGEFLQSSNFAFLCSPFQLQVRVAVAQSYARRNNAPSCTLSDAVGNVKGFLGGDFAQGGWGGLIRMTNEPNNNPFGAFMTLRGGLTNAVGNAQANANLEVNLGDGFLSYKKCDTIVDVQGQPINGGSAAANCKIVTPGSLINDAGSQALGESFKELEIGESISQILAALQNALITKALYGGFSNLNNSNNGASNVDTAAQNKANALLDELRSAVVAAQQYANTQQRIINDVQTAQNNLVGLENCWLAASSSPTLSATQLATAQSEATAAATKILQLESAVTGYNQNIEKANNFILVSQELQTDLLLATVGTDVDSVKSTWTTIKNSDTPHVYSVTDVTAAQQDRTSAQSNIASINVDTSAKLQQCNALR